MKQYIDLVKHVLDHGELRENRTGIKTLSIFGNHSRYDLRDGFPLVTTKEVNFDSVLKELLWFLSGSTNTNDLDCWIRDELADKNGDLGHIYCHQWRRLRINGHENISQMIDGIKKNPNSDRHIVSVWSVADLDETVFPLCHLQFQVYVSDSGFIDLQFYRSYADIALCVPFNIASYGLLLMMIAQECGYVPRYVIQMIWDAHIYINHIDGLKMQIDRPTRSLPTVEISKKPFFDLKFEDFKLVDYIHGRPIKFDVAV